MKISNYILEFCFQAKLMGVEDIELEIHNSRGFFIQGKDVYEFVRIPNSNITPKELAINIFTEEQI